MKRKMLILIVILISLSSCAQGEFSPGPQGPIGPQADLDPQGPQGPSSSDAITIEDSGQVLNKEYVMDPFDELEIHGLEVTIEQGDSNLVTLNVEKNLFEYVFVEQQGSKLKIGIDPSNAYNMGNITRKAEVTTPGLTALDVKGIGMATIDDFIFTRDLNLIVSGVGVLQGNIEAKDIYLDVSSLNQVSLAGSAKEVRVEAQGPCEIDLSGLSLENLKVNADQLCQVTHRTND